MYSFIKACPLLKPHAPGHSLPPFCWHLFPMPIMGSRSRALRGTMAGKLAALLGCWLFASQTPYLPRQVLVWTQTTPAGLTADLVQQLVDHLHANDQHYIVMGKHVWHVWHVWPAWPAWPAWNPASMVFCCLAS